MRWQKQFSITVVAVFLSLTGSNIYCEGTPSDSQLRRFEDEINRPREGERKVSENKSRDDEEKQARLEKERRQWRQEHPGQPYPDYLLNTSDSDNPFAEMFAEFFGYMLASPFWFPYLGLEDNYKVQFSYQRYPFAIYPGFSSIEAEKTWIASARFGEHFVSGQTSGNRFDGIYTFYRWSGEASFIKYKEKIKTRSEFLSFGEGLVTFIFARNDNVDFRAGLGLQRIKGIAVHDGVKSVYRVRWFRKPFHGDIDLGLTFGFGRSPLLEFAPNVGVLFKHGEVGVGCRRLSISDEHISGPEIGIRFWF